MYIAICDDQAEDLNSLTELLRAWGSNRGVLVRMKGFRSAAASASRSICPTS